ncbi:MAG: hypothetical protein HKP21_08470 [Xanthomonadales bacterium]|nr:hypothetical protein [Gammaproteobacteria bacterium]MBT8073727.1 hypothetical protein [Gammaproteobacteria bacterium]NNK04573.1 hypothetical protein [Xanthomonadales bacterium]
MSFFKELKRRNVFKVGIAYAVSIWILLQLTDVISQILVLPEWAPKLILLILLIGFVPALILAWAFELTPEGVKLEKDVQHKDSITPKTGRKLDYVIIVSLGLSLGYFIWESRFEQKTAELESMAAAPAPEIIEQQPAPPVEVEPVAVDKNSIAVLPFANRSADAEDVYFTDGIHDDLLTQLSKIDAFSVISRTSVMEYRDTTKNLREIARELSVANIMEGSVQRSGDRVRINVQLIDAGTDEHMWAEIYDRELTTGNLFDIQTEIAKAIAAALKATLTETELASVADVPTENVVAYDLYLQARRFAQNETRNGYAAAVELFEESLALDPDFKFAWIGLARSNITNYWLYGGDPRNRELARQAIDRARQIDANFAELYMAEGFYWYWGHLDYERALYNLKKAIEIMPGNDEAHMWRGWVSRRAGLWEQAEQSMLQALKLNPREHFNWAEYALTAMYLHKYMEANKAVNQSRALNADSYWGRINLARIALQEKGDTQTALQMTIGAQHSNDYSFLEEFLHTRVLARRFEEALEAARGLTRDLEIQRGTINLKEDWSAQILHFMGRQEEAQQAANAALFRLQGLREEPGDQHRIDIAEAMVNAIRGSDPEAVKLLVKKAMASAPQDEVAAFRIRFDYARVFAIAGMAAEAIEMLESVLLPPSDTSIYIIDLDPAFDSIRDTPEFLAMTGRYR